MSIPPDVISRIEAGQGTDDDGLILLAAMQAQIDRLKELEDELPPERDLLIRIDGGTVIKFQDVTMVADWIVGMKNDLTKEFVD